MNSFGYEFDRNGTQIPAYVKSTCLMLARNHAPYRTGNLKYNGIGIEEYSDRFIIYIDEEIAKYGVWLDQWKTLGGWHHSREAKQKISKANSGMKKLRNQTPKELRSKSIPGQHPNPHYGWFSDRALKDILEYLKNKYNGRVVY